MRYGIFSDVHSNLEAFSAVIQAYKEEKIDKYLCAGDIVGYAADPGHCIARVKEICVIGVAGNHDWASADLFSIDYFNPMAAEAILWTQRNLDAEQTRYLASLKLVYQNADLTLVHGTLYNPQDFNYMMDEYTALRTFALMQARVCFVGHSHIAGIFSLGTDGGIRYCLETPFKLKDDNKYIINVGSVGQPRDSDPRACYCIYDTERKELWIKRVSYDLETARLKIYRAGLPGYLGDRLLTAN